MTKRIGYGATLTVATSTAGTTTIAQIRSMSGPGASGNAIDTTTLDSSSNYRTFVGGLVDGGDFTFDLLYDPEHTSHNALSSLLANRDVRTWTVSAPSTVSQTFSGFVNGLGREVPLDDVITQDVTIKVTGAPGYTTT